MENLPKDILVLLAMDLNYPDILKLCNSSKRINNFVCNNNDFWRNKLYQTYPFSYELEKKFQHNNFKKLYRDIETLLKKINLKTKEEKKVEAGSFRRPDYVTQELADFFLHADLGFVPETKIPLNYILWSLLKDKILSRALATRLFVVYINKYEFKENDRKYYKAGPEMEKYLEKYLTELELEDIKKNKEPAFNRNKFLFNRIPGLLGKGFIPRSSLTEEQNINLEKYTSILDNIDKYFL